MSAETETLKRSLQIYKGLVEVSGLINSITDYDKLLRAILDVARRVNQAEVGSLFFVNEETDCLDLIMASAAEGEYVRPVISVPKGRGISGWVFAHGESLLIPDAYADDRFYQDADKKTGFRTRSILCAPLKRDQQVIGVLQILNPRDKEAFDEQDLEGFTAYANLIAIAIERLRTLEQARRQERVERDLSIAAEIQQELLSRAVPASIPGLSFAAHNCAASNVGGDFYNIVVRSADETYFAIGDVSGKGIPAALLMAQTLSAMQFIFAASTSPAETLARLNETLHRQIVRGMFITTIVGRVIPSTGALELASAGHCKPIVVRATGEVEEIQPPGALPLGILPQVSYQQITIPWTKGDWLVLYTDGLSESRDPEHGEFFEKNIMLSLQDGPFTSPQAIIDHLVARELTHRGKGRQHDDLTIVVGGLA